MSQNLIMIWLDRTYESAAAAKTHSTLHRSLCEIDPYLVTFRHSDKCIDYITDLNEDKNKIVLIISNELPSPSPDTLLLRSEELLQIDSVYMLF